MNAKEMAHKILEHCEKIIRYCENIESFEEFHRNSMLQDAIAHNLIQIGEKSKHPVMGKFRTQFNTLPWKEIGGLRNLIVHDYDNIRMKQIWEILQNDIEPIFIAIKTILNG